MDGDGGDDGYLSGGPGDDRIDVDDGQQDQVHCGPGADTVGADSLDGVATDPINGCETINRAAGNPGGGAGNPGGGAGNPGGGAGTPSGGATRHAPTLRVSAPHGGIRGLIAHGLVARVTCPGACRIAATLLPPRKVARRIHLARTKLVKVGSGHRTLIRAGRANVKVKPSRKARRRLKKLRKARFTLRVGGSTAGHHRTTETHALELRKRR